MATRGRKPKPTATKKLEGNPGRRPLNEREPVAPAGDPQIPEWLREDARPHWESLAPLLKQMCVLTRADAVALALLCDAIADYIQARAVVEAAAGEEGTRFISVTDKGNVIQHPAVSVMHTAWERTLKAAREFGLTPSSRTSIKADKPTKANEFFDW